MAESTLSLVRNDLMNAIAREVGYAREADPTSPASWSASQVSDIGEALNGGLRLGYRPPALPGEKLAHSWSYLRPTTYMTVWGDTTGTVSGDAVYASPNSTITATAAAFYPTMIGHSFVFDTSEVGYPIVSYTSSTVVVVSGDASGEATGDTYTITATGEYRLPDDFGGIVGPMFFEKDEGAYAPIIIKSPLWVRRAIQHSDSASRPYNVAIEPLATTGSAGQRFNAILFPIPDTTYDVHYRYQVHPDALSSALTYPWGGMASSEYLRSACILAAVRRFARSRIPEAEAEFFKQLEAAVHHDRNATAAQDLGFCTDPSVGVEDWRTLRHRFGDALVYHEGQVN